LINYGARNRTQYIAKRLPCRATDDCRHVTSESFSHGAAHRAAYRRAFNVF
jgi:hypothetical protein